MQLIQEYVQKSIITTLPFNSSIFNGSELIHPCVPVNSGAAPRFGNDDFSAEEILFDNDSCIGTGKARVNTISNRTINPKTTIIGFIFMIIHLSLIQLL